MNAADEDAPGPGAAMNKYACRLTAAELQPAQIKGQSLDNARRPADLLG
jgi:hypothetical protein